MSISELSKPTQSDWITRLARGRAGIASVSALESTILPIPLEAILVPLMTSRPRSALSLGIWALIGCVAGSAALYAFGVLLAEPVVEPVIDWLGLSEAYKDTQDSLQGGQLFWTVFALSVSPAPIQLASLGTGATGGNLVLFLAAITASRGIRYLGLAGLAWLIGPRLEDLHVPKWAVLAVTVLAVILYLLLR